MKKIQWKQWICTLLIAAVLLPGMTSTVSVAAVTAVDTEQEIQYSTETCYNPLYPQEEYAESYALRSTAAADDLPSFSSMEEAAVYVRQGMVERKQIIAFEVTLPAVVITEENCQTVARQIVDIAMAHSEECTGQEGDALTFGYQNRRTRVSYNNTNWMKVTLEMTYRSTAEEEIELTRKVAEIMSSLNLDGASEYEKVKAVYQYICDNVTYDYTYSHYDAYNAAVHGTAVCQGYSVLFYRLCKEAGLSVRVIPGFGNGSLHAWNIVKIGSYYYNVDSTWDEVNTPENYRWFLHSQAAFPDHVREEVYLTEEFMAAYPMAAVSYDPAAQPTITPMPTPVITLTPEQEQRQQVESFVERLYSILLDREVDTEGLTYWTDILADKKDTGANVAAGILFSPELDKRNLTDEEFVRCIYLTVFDREPDPEGRTYWLDTLAGGETRNGAGRNLLNSAEFGQICAKYGILQGQANVPEDESGGSGNTGTASTELVQNFVKRLYSILLDREVDTEGLGYWSTVLINKQDTGARVASNIIFSEELTNRDLSDEEYVACLYKTVFDREPDENGKAYWISVLAQGEPRNNVGRELLNSPEFGAVCREYHIEQGWIDAVPLPTVTPNLAFTEVFCYNSSRNVM